MNVRLTAVAAVTLGLLAAHLAVPGLAGAGGSFVNLYNGIAILCVGIAAWGVATYRRRELVWWALVVTLALWTLGDIIYELLGTDPTISIADIAYALGYVTLIGSLWMIVRHDPNTQPTDRAIDVGVAVLGTTYAVFELVLSPLWLESTTSVAGRLVSSAYPIADVALIVLALFLLVERGTRSMARTSVFIGVIALFLADTIYAILAQTDAYGGDTHVLDTLWLLSYVAIAIAAHSRDEERTELEQQSRVAVPQLLIAVVALMAVPTVSAIAPLIDHEVNPFAAVGVAAAITALIIFRYLRLTGMVQRAHHALEASEHYYRTLTIHSTDVTLVLGPDNRVLDISRPLPFKDESNRAVFLADPLFLSHPEDHGAALALLADARSQPGVPVIGELRMMPYDDQDHWLELRCTSLEHLPHIGGVVVNAREITDRKRAEAELAHQALHDGLTGLANRALLGNRIDHALGRLDRDGGEVAVVFCDIDGFKSVNESLGQEAGDTLLRRVAERLTTAVRAGDTVARIGGDEFAILVDSVGDLPGSTTQAMARLRDAIAEPIVLEGTPLVISFSMGIAVADADTSSAGQMLRNADLALYQAKRQGRGNDIEWQPHMGEVTANRLQLEADLRDAVRKDELILHYQPLVELGTGELLGFEALVRWNHPRRGLLMPGDFITIAEESGLIVGIGEWVLRTACRTAAHWAELTPKRRQLEISVNLSAHQLADPHLADMVLSIVEETGINPAMLVLELTESVLVERAEEANVHLAKLGEHGIRLAIDDFGTGYSSLAYLQQFAVDIVKIDRAFTNTIVDEWVPPLVRGMLELSRSLGAECIAEGIEEPHQATALADAGCSLGQGFWYSRPVELSVASALVHGRRDLRPNSGSAGLLTR